MTSFRVGALAVVPLEDARGSFPLGELFPHVEWEEWRPFREQHPALFGPDRTWRPPFTAYLLRIPEVTVLVDTGVGPENGGRLLDLVDPDEVDVVVCTHLHGDHVGWNVRGDGTATFPRARYVVPEEDWLRLRTDPPAHLASSVAPLERAGVLDLGRGGEEVAPGVELVASAGHTSGHLAVRAQAGGRPVWLTGDVALHPAQVAESVWASAPDADPEQAVETRRAIFARAAAERSLVGGAHFPAPHLGTVVHDAGRLRWRPGG